MDSSAFFRATGIAALALVAASCDLRNWSQRKYCRDADGDPCRCYAKNLCSGPSCF